MKQSFSASIVALLAGLAVLISPLGADAQMDFGLEEADESESDTSTGDGTEGDGTEEGDMSFGEDEAEGDGTDEADFGEGDGDIIGELAGGGDDLEEERSDAPRRTESVEEIFAVQRVYVLRLNRVELAPSASFTVNDPYLAHPSVTLALNYWWTNVLALGVSFQWFQWGDP